MIKLLDFYATWCGPCKMLSPIIDELSEDRSLEVVKIDIDKNEDLVKEFGIMSVPTIVLLKDNKEVARNIGFIRKNDFLHMNFTYICFLYSFYPQVINNVCITTE